jgi:rubrerythrin
MQSETRTLATKQSKYGFTLYLVRLPNGMERWVSVPPNPEYCDQCGSEMDRDDLGEVCPRCGYTPIYGP